MNFKKYQLFLITGMIALCIILVGCGVSDKDIKGYESRVTTLENKGVPDTMLTVPKVLIEQVKACKMSGNTRSCKKYNDSLVVLLGQVEAWYASKMEEFKPFVDSMHSALTAKKKDLTGMHLRAADSIFVIVDSFISQNWLLQAKHKLTEFADIFTILLDNEEKAKKVRPKIIGRWKSVETPMDKNLKFVWTRNYNFLKDGTVKTHEKKKGKSEVGLIEDWEFYSSGKWDLIGDTIMIFIDKEKCTRQTYTTLKIKDGKEVWEKNEQPTYDTTFTEKTKDSYMTYDYLSHYLDKKK